MSPVKTLALSLLMISSAQALAATSSSWQQQPAWANETTPSRKAVLNEDRGAVAPFTPGSNNLSLDVGQIFLMGDLSSNYNDNIGSQLHYTYGVSDLFGFDASLGYSEHSDGAFSMTTLLAGLRTNLAWYDKVVPYAIFGMGFYRPSYQETASNGTNLTSIAPVLFGVHLGPGVHLELTRKLFFGASLTFHDVFSTTKITQNGPRSVGGTFTSFFLNAGVTF
ncbi:MAG: porin family protein [Oligoflexia bacterium]|nr:porin family protein [Oligoflexia bacterium]